MRKIKSWFNRMVEGALRKGVVVGGEIHKASPVKSKTGKGWYKGECPKCHSKNGFVFRSHTDGKVYILFCQRCGKYSWSRKKPVEHEARDIRDVEAPTNPMDAATKGMVQAAQDLRCNAIKQDGHRCRYKAKANGFCGIHGGNDMPLY